MKVLSTIFGKIRKIFRTPAQREAAEWAEMIPQNIVLSEEAFDQMMKHIENPPPPTEALIKAMKKYRDKYGRD